MKKNLIYLFSLLCSLSLFTACSDDDDKNGPDEPTPTTWKDYVGEYGTKNTLVLNGADLTSGSLASVTVSTGSNDKAKLVLTNIFPEKPVLEIDNVEMTEKDGVYGFSGEAAVDESVVSFTGTLTPGTVTKATEPVKAKVSINTTRKITSNLVGTWNLRFRAAGIADFQLDLKTDNSEVNIFLPAIVPPAVGGLIGDKVEDVTVKFQENGIFDFSWRPAGNNADVTLVDIIKSIPQMSGMVETIEKLLVFQYYTYEENVYIVLSKDMVALAFMMKDMIPVDIEAVLTALLQSGGMLDQGAYYILPLNMVDDGEGRVFSADRRLTLPAVNMVLGMINWDEIKDLPALAPFDKLIEAALTSLPNAETLSVGLGFTKK